MANIEAKRAILPKGRVGASESEKLAERVRELILTGVHERASSLPSERDLMAEFNLSRATVREALRRLEGQGLIEIRRGRNGGSFVCGPSLGAVSRSLDLFINGYQIRLADLVSARAAIEPVAAGLAARERTTAELNELFELSAECERSFGTVEAFCDVNLRWHLAIVRASHNGIFEAFMNSIAPAIHAATDLHEFDIKTRKAVVGLHWQIFNAIKERDEAAASRRMGRHVTAYHDSLSDMQLLAGTQ
jgi:GntR family transcriptional repressor for pyruvate dehydrogenase complex